MDNKNISKVSSFFKKEGFYVILFVCLCIIATVAVTVTNNNILGKKEPVAQGNKSAITAKVATAANEAGVDYSNALEVKKNPTNDIKVPATATETKIKTTASVANVFDTKFIKPVDGTMARQYTVDPVYWASTTSYRPNFGIDIKAAIGKPVVAVLDGKVESINQATEDGVEVTINHQNGLKSVYSNLDPKISVTKDQTVKKGDQIGVVGKSTLRAAYETYGDHLHFAILKGTTFIDPIKYIKY